MDETKLMKVSELVPLLGVTTGRIYQMIADGLVPAKRFGRALRVPRPAFEEWLARCAAEANRSAKQAAVVRERSRPEPATDTERAVSAAVRELARGHGLGWRGSATELLEQLREYRPEGASRWSSWPGDARALAIVLRRLVVHLEQGGVRISVGHRGYRGKRLVSISTSDFARGCAPSAATQRDRGSAAPSMGSRSSRTRADARGGGYTGTLLIDAEVLERYRKASEEAPTEPDPR
jgi:excisionase family DNA binding protein